MGSLFLDSSLFLVVRDCFEFQDFSRFFSVERLEYSVLLYCTLTLSTMIETWKVQERESEES
jgi:hypothetical protein